jgi:hypothetical protein
MLKKCVVLCAAMTVFGVACASPAFIPCPKNTKPLNNGQYYKDRSGLTWAVTVHEGKNVVVTTSRPALMRTDHSPVPAIACFANDLFKFKNVDQEKKPNYNVEFWIKKLPGYCKHPYAHLKKAGFECR